MNQHYSNDFKNQILSRWKSKESVISISNKTGIPRSTIYRWIHEFETEASMQKNQKNKEVKELERKIEKLQTMLDIIYELGIL